MPPGWRHIQETGDDCEAIVTGAVVTLDGKPACSDGMRATLSENIWLASIIAKETFA